MFDWLGDALMAIVQPIVDGVLGGIIEVVFEPFMRMAAWLFVNFILRFTVAVPLWNLNKLLILIAIGIAKFTEVLIDYLFVSAFNIIAEDFGLRMLPLVFTIALTLLGFTYVLAAFWMRSTIIVDWKKAFAWLLFAWLFYTFGADFFVQSYILERSLGTVLYEVAVDLNLETEEDILYPLNELFSGSDVPPTDPEDMFGQGGEGWLKYDVSIDGVDIAMSYFLATPDDLTTANLIDLPDGLDDAFFGGGVFDIGSLFTNDAFEILSNGIAGVLRLLFGVFINIFAILDQVVSLWIAIGLALTFFMLLWVVLLAFFNATEPIAKYLVRSWLDFMLLALFSGIIKAIGLFILLLAADIPHPIIWTAGGALGLAIGILANMQAIDGVMQLMRNIQGSVTSAGGTMTGGMQVMPMGQMGGMGGMGGMGRMGGGGMGGGMGGMASMNPKMMAAQAALGAIGGSAGRGMAGGGGTSPTTGIRSIMSPNYGSKGGMMMHADQATSPTEGRPKQGAAFGAAQSQGLNMSPGGKGGAGGSSGGAGGRSGLSPTDGKPLPTPPSQSGSLLTSTRRTDASSGGSPLSGGSPQGATTTPTRPSSPPPPSPKSGKIMGPPPSTKPPTNPGSGQQ